MGVQWIQQDAEVRGVYIQAGSCTILSIESGGVSTEWERVRYKSESESESESKRKSKSKSKSKS